MAAWKLHTMPLSHWCIAAERMLDYKGVPYEKVYTRYDDHTALMEISGQDYVPWLQTGPREGVAWHALPDFLERHRPSPTLYPDGQAGLGKVVEDWAHQVVEETVWKYVCSDAPATFDDARERWVFVEMQERRRGPLEVMALRKPEFEGGVRQVCALAEGLLGTKPYLLGDAPSLADFALYGSLWPLPYTGNAIPPQFARLREWFDRVAKLP